MSRAISGLTYLAGFYVFAAIAWAGIDLPLGSARLQTMKLINPAMAFLVLAFVRAWRARSNEEPEKPLAPDSGGGARTVARAWLYAIAPLAVFAWWRALSDGVIREDFQRITQVASGAPFNGALWADASFFNFWSRQTSLALDALCWPHFGLDPAPWHAVNLGLHLAVALCAGLLALALTRRTATGVLATALVALMPMAVEPVCWIAGRDDSVAAFLALISALALVRAVRAGIAEPLADERGRLFFGRAAQDVAWMALSVAASLLALFAKESTLSLAGALVPVAWLAASRGERSWRGELGALARACLRVVPHGLVLAVYVIVRSRALAAQGWTPGATFTDWPKILLFPLSPVAPLAFPVNMEQIGELAWYGRAICGGSLVAAVLVALARFRPLVERETLGLYALLLGFTVPVYRMICLSATLQNNRYLYLPGTAFAMLAAHLLVRNARAVRGARLVPALLVASAFALVRMNAEPWVAVGAVAKRLNAEVGALVEPLARHPHVRIDGVPEQFRGAFLLNLSDLGWALEVCHKLPLGQRHRLVELYHAGAPRPERAVGEPEFHWSPDQGLVAVPDPKMLTTRSLSAPSTYPALLSGSIVTR